MYTGALGAYNLLSRLKDDILNNLTAVPARACIVPGEVAWEECDCDGQLTLALQRLYASDEFPRASGPSGGTYPCDAAWLVCENIVTLIRCAPLPQGSETHVDCNVLDDVGKSIIQDAVVLYSTITCTLASLKDAQDIMDYNVSDGLVLGPEGGCVGTQVIFSFSMHRLGA